MKFFIGTYNEKYKKRLHSVLSKDYKLEFIENDDQVLQIFENALTVGLGDYGKNHNHDYFD